MKDYRVSWALCALAAMAPAMATAQESSASAAVEEVVVTGSRIMRRDFNSNTPIVSIGAQTVENTGVVTLDTALKEQPQFVAATGATTNSSGNQGQANVQLRGLGRTRTLVLMDGRRLPAANVDGSVDINAIPTALIENVEIITGGASAVYGSDAIAGVVNIRTRRNFDGFDVAAQYGISGEGDAADYKVSLTAGGAFSDGRGNGVLSLEYANRDSILYSDRDWTLESQRDTGLPMGQVSLATNSPTQAAINAAFARYGVAPGAVTTANSVGINADGTLFSNGVTVQNYRGSTDPDEFFITPQRIFAEGRQYRYLQLPLERYSIFGRVNYDIFENHRATLQFFYTHSLAATQLQPAPLGASITPTPTSVPPVPITSPFIPADLRPLLAARADPNAPILYGYRLDGFGPRLQEGRNNTFQIVAALNGPLGILDWTYDLEAALSRNSVVFARPNWQSRSQLQRLINAPDGGVSLCTGGFNPFRPYEVSDECRAFVNRTPETLVSFEEEFLDATVQGGLFSLPAGEVRFAGGVEHRRQYVSNEADDLILLGDILVGSGDLYQGQVKVTELFSELEVPLLKGFPLVKELSTNLGYRYSKYSTIGGVHTYRATGNWEVFDTFRIRGGYERAIRAPNIGELFAQQIRGTAIIGLAGAFGSGDPCDVNGAYRRGPDAAQVRQLCLATGVPAAIVDTYTRTAQSAAVLSGGNNSLQEEVADSYSVGAVWRPALDWAPLRNLSFSLDYYSISVDDAIGSITAPLVLSRCFNADGQSNSTYSAANVFCSRISRDPNTGGLEEISQQVLNLAGYKTSGVDLQVDWHADLIDLGLDTGGRLSVNVVSGYLSTFRIKSLPSDPFAEYAGTIGNGQIDPVAISRPTWKTNTSVTYTRDSLSLGATWRYIGKMSNASNVGTSGNAAGVGATSYFGLNARYRFDDRIELWGAITNLTDKQPPVYPAPGSTDQATYDAIGRRFTVGVRAHF